jgi:hypothetical protein
MLQSYSQRILATLSVSAALVIGAAPAAATPAVPAGYSVHQVGTLAGKALVGIAIAPVGGELYVATEVNSNSVELWRMSPLGVTTLVGTYSIQHVSGAVDLEWGPDGRIYVATTQGGVISAIDPVSGSMSTYSNSGIVTARHGLEFDAAGNLIVMIESTPNRFFRAIPGSGNVFLGTYTLQAGEHGDRFGINPDGDYVVHSDGGDGRIFKLIRAGHVDGTNFTRVYMAATNIFTLAGMGVQYSVGAVDPITGDVFSSTTQGGVGSQSIVRTGAAGGPASATTLFVTATRVSDLDFGPRTDTGQGRSLFFLEKSTSIVWEVRGFNSAPVASAAAPEVVECASAVTVDGSGSTDPDGDTLTYEWSEGANVLATTAAASFSLPVGSHTLTLEVTDPAGLTSTTSVTVTVADTTAPVISSASVSPNAVWPPNHKMVPVSVTVSLADACGGPAECVIASVSSNEPADGLGDGDVANDWEITGPLTVNVRAERSGTGAGRVYTVVLACTDADGNTSTQNVAVTVPHSLKK